MKPKEPSDDPTGWLHYHVQDKKKGEEVNNYVLLTNDNPSTWICSHSSFPHDPVGKSHTKGTVSISHRSAEP
jgi:hypothetical protein